MSAGAGGLSVRRARPEDLDAVVAVISAVASERRFIRTEPEDVDPDRLQAAIGGDAGDVLWVLEDASAVVGTAGLHPTAARGVAILGMAIVAEARGRGGGQALVSAALVHASQSGLHKVELEVFPDNTAAVALYARNGFTVEGLRQQHHARRDGSRRDVLLMARIVG